MTWKEILVLWFVGQIGNLISMIFGVPIEVVTANLYFTGIFAFALTAIAFFRKDYPWK